VLREYAVVMTRADVVERPLSAAEVGSDIEKWTRTFRIADETDEVTEILVDLIKTHEIRGKRIHDANIVATMKANSIEKLWTLNVEDFKGMPGIELITAV
jgi:predicted nucleic acid-binding protein